MPMSAAELKAALSRARSEALQVFARLAVGDKQQEFL